MTLSGMTGLLIIRATDEEAIGIFVEKIAVGDYGMADFLFGSLAGNPGYGTASFGNFDVLAHPFLQISEHYHPRFQ